MKESFKILLGLTLTNLYNFFSIELSKRRFGAGEGVSDYVIVKDQILLFDRGTQMMFLKNFMFCDTTDI